MNLETMGWKRTDKKYDKWYRYEKISVFSGILRVWNNIYINKKTFDVQFSIYNDLLELNDIVALSETIKQIKESEKSE
jgi:hypothetical protein